MLIEYLTSCYIGPIYRYGDLETRISLPQSVFSWINVVGKQNEFHSVLEFSSLLHGKWFESLAVKSNKSNDIY